MFVAVFIPHKGCNFRDEEPLTTKDIHNISCNISRNLHQILTSTIHVKSKINTELKLADDDLKHAQRNWKSIDHVATTLQ